jgi:hypothetical protein
MAENKLKTKEVKMFNVKDHINLLGMRVKDKVTGYAGVITSISFDLYGCVQAIVHPGLDDNGKLKESNWFDVGRLEVTDDKPAMDQPDFDFGPAAAGKKGPAEKPCFMKS